MDRLAPHQVVVLFLSLGILLGLARALGELAQRLRQPAVLGELIAGVLLGPTVLGALVPGASAFLFPPSGPNAVALEAIATLSAVLFLLVAGMEMDLSTAWRQGRVGFKIGVASIAVPFAVGLASASLAPQLLGRHAGADSAVFALFFATALSITALPVIAKTLMDMDLYRSDFGMVVVSAAVFNDIVGWIVFAVVLGMMGAAPGVESRIASTIVLTLVFVAAMLTVGRWAIHRALPLLQAYTRWPGGVLGFALTLALLGAAFTEWIGIHAIFGAFVVGVVVGDSSHLRERTRVTIGHFVSFIFAPLFFASIGLKVDFLAHFDASVVASVLAIACISKLAGGTLGARWGGMPPRSAWAAGFAMNSRGAMEIILGLLALDAGIIRQRLFVALVVMAIVTSTMSGPAMRAILGHTKRDRLRRALASNLFLRGLRAGSRRELLREMSATAAAVAGLDPRSLEAAVWAREETLGTGIGKAVAIPHARVPGLKEPLVAVGISDVGVDFDAPDGLPAKVVFLVLTPAEDSGAQLELLAEIARTFRDARAVEGVLRAGSYTSFLAHLNSLGEASDLD